MRIVVKRKVADTAKVLMIISITLLVYGIILNVTSNNVVIDPTKSLKDNDESVISITTSDGSEITPDTSGKSNTGKSSIVNNSTNNSTNNNRISDDTNISAVDKENALLRKAIEKDFDITVKYGEETIGYSVGGVSSEPIIDSDVINAKLNDLYDTLNLYPTGIFKEIKDGGIPLTIILVNRYSESSVTGITDSSYEYANISISAVHDFAESFYHESYHYMERYMFKKKVNFNSWSSLNPDSFSYGTIDGSLSYSNTFSSKAPFVNNYAQTSEAEDRASTFEYMMADTKASCLNKNEPVWYKATYMAMTMETVFNTISPDTVEYWERFIKDE